MDERREKMSNFICPNCGSTYVRTFRGNGYNRCTTCEHKWDIVPEPSDDNPYTDFAKEMSLLHEALKAEGFKDAMVDILAKMTPIVWDKVERKKTHERLKEAVKNLDKVEYQSPGWLETIPKEVEVKLE
jgi:uncharacterized Zn finger protein (UPF0148 family)